MATSRRNALLVGGVLLFWAVMTALLVHRELRRSPDADAAAPAALGSRESWLGLYLGDGPRIGFVHLARRPERRQERAGIALQATAELRARLFEAPARVRLSGTLWRALDEPRAELDARVSSEGHDVRLTGRIENGELRATLRSGGEAVPLRVPVAADLIGSDPTLLELRLPDLGPGEEATVRGLDPLTLRPTVVRVRGEGDDTVVLGGTPTAVRRLAVEAGGTRLTVWAARDGEIVAAATPWGLELRRITRQEALTEGAAAELAAAAAVTPTGVRPRRGARRMVVRPGGLDPRDAVPTDETQAALPGGALEITAAESRGLPVRGVVAAAETAPFLAADPLIQSDHPRIRALAAEIAGREGDPWRRALAIHHWVATNVAKRPVLGLPSALDVLARREGDCNEHTVLFAALARAAGVPTRTTIGVVWSEELEGFAYHAWPEVWVGRWVWMDPTLEQPVADATHVKLASGGLESWPRVLAFLGRLRLEVEEVE
jgi:transglutaminase-like putative cysteine protease